MCTFQRGEHIALSILITVGILGAGLFYAYYAFQEHNTAVLEEQARDAAEAAFENAAQTISMGQPTSLTAEDTKQVTLWSNGTKEFTVSRATLYSSLQDASNAEELGNIIEAVPPDDVVGAIAGGSTEGRILLLEITIHNIDATNNNDTPYEFLIESDISLNCDSYRLATFSGSPIDAGSKEINTYTLAPGESATYLFGFWIRADEDLSALTAGIGNSLGIYGVAPITVELNIDDKTR